MPIHTNHIDRAAVDNASEPTEIRKARRRMRIVLVPVLVAATFLGTAALPSDPRVPQVVGVAEAQAALPTTAVPNQLAPANWFTDWQTCIWGIGVPTALARRYPGPAKQVIKHLMRRHYRQQLVTMYGERVISACERFIRS